jgi:hypothetical protein
MGRLERYFEYSENQPSPSKQPSKIGLTLTRQAYWSDPKESVSLRLKNICVKVRHEVGVRFLGHGDTFCQVTRPVWIQSSFNGHMIRKQLKRNHIDDGGKERVHLGRHFHEAI